MMDVLEHQQDPREFIRNIAVLLRDDGILMLQLPCYDGHSSFTEAIAANAPWLAGLKPVEHPFVYSRESLGKLLAEFNFTAIAHHRPIFPYDMFLVASREPLKIFNNEEIKKSLMKPASISAFAALNNFLIGK